MVAATGFLAAERTHLAESSEHMEPRNTGPTESEIRQAFSIASLAGWAATEDRTARTANGRRAFQEKFLIEAGGDPVRAETLRRLFYKRMSLKSAEARRLKREADQQSTSVDREVA